MNSAKQQLIGSDSRDRFKHLHKNKLHQQFYALDIDFALIERNKWAAKDGSHLPFIVAILDFKLPSDDLTFSEVLAYNQFRTQNIPVYIVEALSDDFVNKHPSEHRFTVYEYQDGDWEPDPPTYSANVELEDASWRDFEKWQDKLRIDRRDIAKVRHKINKEIERAKEQTDELEMYEAIDVMKNLVMENDEIVELLTEKMQDTT